MTEKAPVDPEIKKEQKKYSERTNAKKPYKCADGKRAVSVTTVLNNVAKPGLIHWSWDLGLDGVDYKAYRDEMADVGKLAHKFCLESVGDPDEFEMPTLTDYSPFVIKLAKSGLKSWRKWLRDHPAFKPKFTEYSLVSEKYRFGGRLDLYGKMAKRFTLIDLKFQPTVYDEAYFQVAAYAELLKENGHPVDRIILLRMDRVGSANYDEIVIDDWSIAFDCFLSMLNFHEMRKLMRKQNA